MAEKLGVARQSARRWANDQVVPKQIYVKEWALICGVPYRWLAYGDVAPDPSPGTVLAGQRGRVLTYIASRKCASKASVIPHLGGIGELGPFPGRIAA